METWGTACFFAGFLPLGYDFFSFMEIAGNQFSDRIPGFVVTPFSGFLA